MRQQMAAQLSCLLVGELYLGLRARLSVNGIWRESEHRFACSKRMSGVA